MSFEALWSFLVAHVYIAIFLGTLIDAVGIPFPGRLMLITAGGIAALGSAAAPLLIALAATAALIGDHVWFIAGRLGGDRLLRLYCRLVMRETTSCVDRAKAFVARFGPASFVVGRFVAGIRILITPLAASSGMPYVRYLLFDAFGAGLWASVWVLVGYLLGAQWAAWEDRPGVGALGAVVSGGAVLTIALTLAVRWHLRRPPSPPAA